MSATSVYEAYKQAQRDLLADRTDDIQACVQACETVCGVAPHTVDPRLEYNNVVVVVDDMFELRYTVSFVQIKTGDGWEEFTLDNLAKAEVTELPKRDEQALLANTAKVLHQVYDVLLLTYSIMGGDSDRLRALHAAGKLGHAVDSE